jgi:hypothetical protein
MQKQKPENFPVTVVFEDIKDGELKQMTLNKEHWETLQEKQGESVPKKAVFKYVAQKAGYEKYT